MLDLFADCDYDVREEIAALEAAEIAYEKAEIAYRSYEKLANLKIKEAALRAAMEGGDMETLCDYYSEAEDATSEKKQGLLSKAWTSLKNLLRKIKETLFGKQVKGGTVSESDKSFMDTVRKKGGEVISKIKSNPFKSIAVLTTVVAGLYLIVKTITKKKGDGDNKEKQVKVTDQEAKGFKKVFDDFVATVEGVLGKDPQNSAAGNEKPDLLNKFRSHVSSISSRGSALVNRLIYGKNGASKDNAEASENQKDADEGEDNSTEENTEETGQNSSADDSDDLFGDYYGESEEDIDPYVENLLNEILEN